MPHSKMEYSTSVWRSHRDDRDDFKRLRINDHELILDEVEVGAAEVLSAVRYDEVIEAAILRNDSHDLRRQRGNLHAPRNPIPDGNAEVNFAPVHSRFRTAHPRDHRFDLRVLVLGHELDAALLLDLVRRCAGWDFAWLAPHLRLRSGEPAEPD